MSDKADQHNADAEVAPGVPPPEGAANLIETDYGIGQDNYSGEKFGVRVDIHSAVFSFSALVILAFVILTLALPEHAGPVFNNMRRWLTGNLDWFFLLSGNVFVLLCIALIVSPLGRVRIGGANADPDFSYLSWFSMLFAAGMGVGLVFYGVSEPLSHYGSSLGGTSIGDDGIRTDWAPLGAAAGDPVGAARLGMAATIFHWGFHPWAIYAVVALSLAIFSYNKGLPLTMRSIFYPLIGERVWGWPGHVIDTLAVFTTLFGLATSLGIGATSGLT